MRGLIPAHTGKTFGRRPRLQRCWAHPHSRGENGTISRCVGTGLGSSPLTRGKLVRPQRWSRGRRLIPAHAGKTYGLEARQRHRRAHPRSRGENFYRLRPDRIGRGSSPLTRGKLCRLDRAESEGRLIPAHAGKTSRTLAPTTFTTAHPHSRGENHTHAGETIEFVGSSPLTRGKPEHAGRNQRRRGLIPAHAGKTIRRGH